MTGLSTERTFLSYTTLQPLAARADVTTRQPEARDDGVRSRADSLGAVDVHRYCRRDGARAKPGRFEAKYLARTCNVVEQKPRFWSLSRAKPAPEPRSGRRARERRHCRCLLTPLRCEPRPGRESVSDGRASGRPRLAASLLTCAASATANLLSPNKPAVTSGMRERGACGPRQRRARAAAACRRTACTPSPRPRRREGWGEGNP